MPNRAAISIHCSQQEAAQIHQRATLAFRPLSNYILSVLIPSIVFEEELYAKFTALLEASPLLAKRSVRAVGPRTTILLRCSDEESNHIRKAASRRDMSLSRFVLFTLKRSWVIADKMPVARLRAKSQPPPPR